MHSAIFGEMKNNTSKIYNILVCITFLQCIDRLLENQKYFSIIKDEEQNRLNPLQEKKDSLWDSDSALCLTILNLFASVFRRFYDGIRNCEMEIVVI